MVRARRGEFCCVGRLGGVGGRRRFRDRGEGGHVWSVQGGRGVTPKGEEQGQYYVSQGL